MTIYDDSKHPRGQADNAGKFRDKANSEPEAELGAVPPRVDLASWIPGDDVDQDAQVLEELQLVRDAVAAQRAPATIADELVGSAYAENVDNRDERSVDDMLTELAAVGGITWDMLEAAARAGQLNSPSVLAPHTTSDILASASRDYYAAGKLVELATVKRLAELVLEHYPTAAFLQLEESDQESGGFWNAGIYDADGDEIARSDEIPDSIVDDVDMLCQTLPTGAPGDYDSAAKQFVPDPAYVWLHAGEQEFSGFTPPGTPPRYTRKPYVDLAAASTINLGA